MSRALAAPGCVPGPGTELSLAMPPWTLSLQVKWMECTWEGIRVSCSPHDGFSAACFPAPCSLTSATLQAQQGPRHKWACLQHLISGRAK